ncbi:MAG: DUF1488 family protein [Deltaproteobacteria bacterium]|nr:DUF1488 family protein [Deltaproteobacteria bacterium]
MTLTFSDPIVRDDSEGFYVCLQVPAAYVEVRVPVAALSRAAGSLKHSELLKVFEQHRAKIEAAANQKYDAKQYSQQTGRKIIWIRSDSL